MLSSSGDTENREGKQKALRMPIFGDFWPLPPSSALVCWKGSCPDEASCKSSKQVEIAAAGELFQIPDQRDGKERVEGKAALFPYRKEWLGWTVKHHGAASPSPSCLLPPVSGHI